MDLRKLKEQIRRKGMTQKEFCEMLGISRVAFYQKCKGVYPFRESEVRKAMEILGLTESGEIFGDCFND